MNRVHLGQIIVDIPVAYSNALVEGKFRKPLKALARKVAKISTKK